MLRQFSLAGSAATFQSQKSAVCILLLILNSSDNDCKDATLFLILISLPKEDGTLADDPQFDWKG